MSLTLSDIEPRLKELEAEMDGAMNSALWEYAPKAEINELIALVRKLVSQTS